MRPLDDFYARLKEPVAGCLLAYRQIALQFDPDVTEAWKYNMPFFCYRGKMFCYLWIEAKTGLPYAGFVEGKWLKHPALHEGKRSRMKVMYFDPEKDLPKSQIEEVLASALGLYKSQKIKIRR